MDLLHFSCDGTFSIPAWRLVLIRVRKILMLCVGFICMLPTVVVHADADAYDGRLCMDGFMC